MTQQETVCEKCHQPEEHAYNCPILLDEKERKLILELSSSFNIMTTTRNSVKRNYYYKKIKDLLTNLLK